MPDHLLRVCRGRNLSGCETITVNIFTDLSLCRCSVLNYGLYISTDFFSCQQKNYGKAKKNYEKAKETSIRKREKTYNF